MGEAQGNTESGGELCTRCGLCCHAFHNLGLVQSPEERETVLRFGGELFHNAAGQESFRQPCPAFRGDCSVYRDRPQSCRDYRCQLLLDLDEGRVSRDAAIEIVERLKREVAEIDRALAGVIGPRREIVEDYVDRFMRDASPAQKTEYRDALMRNGVYKSLRARFFDLREDDRAQETGPNGRK